MSGLIFVVIAGLFGLLLGSFLNVVAFRLPQMTVSGIVRHGKSLWFLSWPLSYCPHCETPIPPRYNIPLLGFAFLRGRTACCGRSIGWCYPLIEASGGLIAVAAAMHYGQSVDFVLAMAFMSILLVAAVIDMRKYYLPDILTLSLLWLGLLANIDTRFALLSDAVLGAAGGYLGMYMLAAAGTAALNKPVMGGGDFKLMAALGAWLGWQALPLLLFLACLGGIFYAMVIYGIRTLKSSPKRQKTRRFLGGRFHFGPVLAAAGVIMLFWGDALTSTYWVFVAGGR